MLDRVLQSLGHCTETWGASRVHVQGYAHPDFAPVRDLVGSIVKAYGGGAAVCIYHQGSAVVDVWAGTRDATGSPWQRDTMAPSFSTTKGVAATALHAMVDRGLLDYDDPVCRYWPEFAQAGKQDITVRHILSHRSGMYHIRRMIDRADQMLDWEYVIRAIERTPPIHPPGERTGYHGLTFGFLVGELVQRVSGRRFSDVVQETIAQPLGLDGLFIGTPEHELHRAAELSFPSSTVRSLTEEGLVTAVLDPLLRGAESVLRLGGVELDADSIRDALAPRGIHAFDFSSKQALQATIPAANGLFTARSLARMYAALAAGGALDGVRILSRRTVERATARQGRTHHLHVIPFDMAWRLGYHGVLTTRGVPHRAFGHFGLGGSGAWADPHRQLAVALIVNRGLGSPFGDLRVVRVGGNALACVARLPQPGPGLASRLREV